MARVAEQAERFDDMVDFLKPIVKEKGGDFSVEERNLLSVGFKNLIGGKRTAIRTISAIEQNPKYSKYADSLAAYKKKIEEELFKDCEDIISLIKNDAMKSLSDAEGKAFFQKMIGDLVKLGMAHWKLIRKHQRVPESSKPATQLNSVQLSTSLSSTMR